MNFACYTIERPRRVFKSEPFTAEKWREGEVMDEPSLEDKLKELVREVGGTSNPQHQKLAKLAEQAHDNHKRLQDSVNNLRESLDYLRVCIKYQLFDLEATRRENEYLRKMLEGKDR